MNLTRYFYIVYWLWLCLVLASSPAWADEIHVDFSAAQGGGVDVHDVQINNIRVEVVDDETGEVSVAYYNILFKYDPDTLNLVPTFTDQACAQLQVQVVERDTQLPLGSTEVSVNQIIQLTTDNGIAEFTNLSAGDVLVSVALTGYEPTTQTLFISCEQINILPIELQPDLSIGGGDDMGDGSGGSSLEIDDGDPPPPPPPPPVELPPPPQRVEISVNWGEKPRDLDAHLTGPLLETERFHVYFGQKATDSAQLLVDDVFSASKPENVSIFPPPDSQQLRPGVYRFTVHHFSGEGRLSTSDAVVQLQIDQGEVRSFFPPLINDEVLGETVLNSWIVFELHVNEQGYVDIVPIQEYHPDVLPGNVW